MARNVGFCDSPRWHAYLSTKILSFAFPDKYPIHSSFDHWRFPHGDLPSLWSDLAIPQSRLEESLQGVFKQKAAATARDVTCRISGYRDACEVAHLVPIADGNWFSSNDMQRYAPPYLFPWLLRLADDLFFRTKDMFATRR
jgi:hypothetical protein